jgi:hypothetical protein
VHANPGRGKTRVVVAPRWGERSRRIDVGNGHVSSVALRADGLTLLSRLDPPYSQPHDGDEAAEHAAASDDRPLSLRSVGRSGERLRRSTDVAVPMLNAILRHVELIEDRIPGDGRYPFSIPAVANMGRVVFDERVTFFVGENGSGKSTYVEAIAIKAGFNPEGARVPIARSCRGLPSQ